MFDIMSNGMLVVLSKVGSVEWAGVDGLEPFCGAASDGPSPDLCRFIAGAERVLGDV